MLHTLKGGPKEINPVRVASLAGGGSGGGGWRKRKKRCRGVGDTDTQYGNKVSW